jgi:RNA polymerase sigma factor (sigma-70 family)
MSESPATRPSLMIRLRDPQDGRAWGEFTEIYGPLVERLARRKGLQPADAADLVQEVFRAVAEAIGRWDLDPARGSFRGWLFRVARNRLADVARARRRQPAGTGDTDMLARLEEQAAPDDSEAAAWDEECRRRLFEWAMGRVRGEFSDPTWEAFWRTAVRGESPKDVAETAGTTLGAVYRCKSRVMARLRQVIEQVGESV